MDFWKNALKYHAPASIAGFIFFYLTKDLLKNEALISENPGLTIAILLTVFNFSAFLLYRSTDKSIQAETTKLKVKENEFVDNEVDGDVEFGLKGTATPLESAEVSKNKLKNNKIKGSVNVGVTTTNE